MSVNRPRKIIYHTAVYGTGQLLRGLSSLLLLPLYTHYLLPADYGLVELLSSIIELASLLMGLRVGAAIFKFHADARTVEDKRRVLSTALSLLLIANIIGAALIQVFSATLAHWLAGPAGFDTALRLFSLTLVVSAFNETFFACLRIEDRSLAYVASSAAKFFLQLVLNIVLIGGFGLGYWGIIWASLISSVLLALGFAIWLLPAVGFGIDRDRAASFVRFSLPIMVSSLGMYYISFGNRFFLKAYDSFEALGVYALAYKFGLTFSNLFWSPFAMFWAARQYEYASEPGSGEFFGKVFLYANLVLLPAAVGVIVLTPPFLHLVSKPAYWGAIELVPWVVGASLLLCWADFFRIGMLRAARTEYIAYGTAGTALLITILFVLWIPRHGPLGVAWATFVAFAFRFVYTLAVGQRFFLVKVPWPKLVLAVIYFATVCVALLLLPLADASALAVRAALLGLASAAVLVTPLVDRAHRIAIHAWVRELAVSWYSGRQRS